jgi:hypothetical protein
LDGQAAFLELLAEDIDGRFAVGLFLLAHLAGAGAGDVDDQDFSAKAFGQVAHRFDTFLRCPRAGDGDQNPAHAFNYP